MLKLNLNLRMDKKLGELWHKFHLVYKTGPPTLTQVKNLAPSLCREI